MNKLLLLSCCILPFFSYADFTIKKVGIDCHCPKKITIDKNGAVEIDELVLSKINKLDMSEWDHNLCNKYNQDGIDINSLLNQSNTVIKEKNIPLSKFSIQKIFEDQVWLKVNNDVYIAHIGDIIGNITIKKIDFDKKIVETSKGKIKK
jgi:hypothetical protein